MLIYIVNYILYITHKKLEQENLLITNIYTYYIDHWFVYIYILFMQILHQSFNKSVCQLAGQ